MTPSEEQVAVAARDLGVSLKIADLGATLPRLIQLIAELQQRVEALERKRR